MPLNFVYIASGLCTMNGNITVHSTLITCSILIMVSNVCREVDEVREEGLNKKEESMTDLEEREGNEKAEVL